jgi:hypothetical protein
VNLQMNSASFLIFCKFTWRWPNIRAETCRDYRGYIIKYFVNCCGKEGIIIYSWKIFNDLIGSPTRDHPACSTVPNQYGTGCPKIQYSCCFYFTKALSLCYDWVRVNSVPALHVTWLGFTWRTAITTSAQCLVNSTYTVPCSTYARNAFWSL